MNIKNITSESLRSLLVLTEKKDSLLKAVAEVENEIAKALGGTVGTVTKIAGLRKPAEKTSAPGQKKAKRKLSPEARARIAEAQKARWAARRAEKSA